MPRPSMSSALFIGFVRNTQTKRSIKYFKICIIKIISNTRKLPSVVFRVLFFAILKFSTTSKIPYYSFFSPMFFSAILFTLLRKQCWKKSLHQLFCSSKIKNQKISKKEKKIKKREDKYKKNGKENSNILREKENAGSESKKIFLPIFITCVFH